MPAFEFNTASATAICNLESGMGWVWKKDEAEEDNSNPRSDDRCSTTKIVKSHCTTEEVEPGKFIRKVRKPSRFSGTVLEAAEAFDLSNKDKRSIENLQLQLAPRRVWMASSIHRGV